MVLRHGVRDIGCGRGGIYEGSRFTKGLLVSTARSKSRYSSALV